MAKVICTDLAFAAHENSKKKGFWSENLSNEHALMLVITELSEAIEAHRKGRKSDISYYDEAVERYDERAWFECNIKDTMEDEFADAAIRILDLMGKHGHRVITAPALNYDHELMLTDNLFALTSMIIDAKAFTEEDANVILSSIIHFSKELKIDLDFHVSAKMKYNQLREALHGKDY